ncbi:MAG TPA: autotransporter-associated beta strand repeat-containing protein [Chthoniobacteraceae bacterium]|jgi:autotransporter-associated beta strand protein|nr:autotransporter-associated beta strand repeat-containing protein [Chthoniobacteraceae bacterium]
MAGHSAKAANTIDYFVSGTDLHLSAGYSPNSSLGTNNAPGVDVVLSNSNSNTNLTVGPAGDGQNNDKFGTLDDLYTGVTITIAAGQPLLTLYNGAPDSTGTNIVESNNSVSGAAPQDLLYVESGAGLVLQAPLAFGAGGNLDISGTAALTDGFANVVAGATITKTGAGTLTISVGTVSMAGTLVAGAGSLVLNSGNNNFNLNGISNTDMIDVSTGATLSGTGGINLQSSGTLGIAGSATFGGVITASGSTVFNVTGSALLSGNLVASGNNTTYLLTKTGTGTMTIASANEGLSYTGPVAVNSGTLALSGSSYFASAASVTINNGGTLSLLDGNGNRGLYGDPADLLVGVPTIINAGGLLEVDNSEHAKLGALTLAGGTLALSSAGANGTGSFILLGTVTAGGVAATSTMSATGMVLSETNGTIFNVSSGATNGIDLDVTGSFIPGFSNTNLIKEGNGVMRLTNTNSYTASTVVQAGTLIVSGSLTGTGGASATGGTLEVDGLLNTAISAAITNAGLEGSGKIGGASLTSGTLSPGLNSSLSTTGVLTSTGSVSLDSNSKFAVRLGLAISGTDSDELTLTGGTVSLGNSSLQLTLGNLGNASVGTIYDIINGGSNPVVGQFSQGGTILAGGYTFDIDYNTNAAGAAGLGDYVTLDLAAVPEPQTWAMMAAGAGLLMLMHRGRRRACRSTV